MASISGAKVGHVQQVADEILEGEAHGDAEQGGENGQAHRHQRPERESMMIMAARMPKPHWSRAKAR